MRSQARKEREDEVQSMYERKVKERNNNKNINTIVLKCEERTKK
jgi:hypothetical protein